MTSFDFTTLLNEAKAAGGVVPPGDYAVEVTRAEAVTAQSGRPMIKAWLRVFEGPHANTTIINNFTLSIDNPNALGFFFRHMRAFGLDDNFFVGLGQNNLAPVATALVGRRANVTITHGDWNGQKQPRVSAIKPYAGSMGVPAPGLTSMPGTPSPTLTAMSPAPVPISQPSATYPQTPIAPQPTLPVSPPPPPPLPPQPPQPPQPSFPSLPPTATIPAPVTPVAPVAPQTPSYAVPQVPSVLPPPPAPLVPTSAPQLPPGMTQEIFDAIKASNPTLAESLMRSVGDGAQSPQPQATAIDVPTAPPPLPV